jgi:hypothetical protein
VAPDMGRSVGVWAKLCRVANYVVDADCAIARPQPMPPAGYSRLACSTANIVRRTPISAQ